MKRFGFACALLVGTIGCGQSGDVEGLEGFVCGTDGRTYTVEQAAERDHEVAHRGKCDAPMGCSTPSDCFAGDECNADVCVPVPSGCPCVGVFEPVCGADGRTYINACEARCVDVGVVHHGMCGDDPCALIDCAPGFICEQGQCLPIQECEGKECEPDEICIDWPQQEPAYCVWVGCDSDEQCRRGERCVIDDLCLAPAVVGPCDAAIPRWFYNSNTGECEQFTWGGCGGNDNNFETRDDCEAACPDHDVPKLSIALRAGRCEPDVFCPEGRYAPEIYAPVCGVDGVTYSNPCEAERAGVDIAYDGECIPEVTCVDRGCPEGWTCDFCQTSSGARYICLSPLAGACLPPSD